MTNGEQKSKRVETDSVVTGQSLCEGGLRTRGVQKISNENRPLITIITSTYNAVSQLPATINSIRSLKYQNIEWLVIDGASRDGTLDLLKESQDIIDYWLSEPDKGIYDALNKALPMIRGKWVMFLGAGDTLADVDVFDDISSLLSTVKGKYSIVYGKVGLVSPGGNKLLSIIGEAWSCLDGRWEYGRPKLPYHQGVFHDSELFARGMTFDSSYRIAADGKLLLSVLKQEKAFLFCNRMIANMVQDGVSSDPGNMMACYREFLRSCQETGYVVPVSHRLGVLLRIIVKGFLYKIIPNKWYQKGIRFVRQYILKRTDCFEEMR